MITNEHTAPVGGCKGAATSGALYIDHLTPDQLRRRAADDRADALALAGRLSAGSVAMLLSDAARCELRAAVLEMEETPRFEKIGDAACRAA